MVAAIESGSRTQTREREREPIEPERDKPKVEPAPTGGTSTSNNTATNTTDPATGGTGTGTTGTGTTGASTVPVAGSAAAPARSIDQERTYRADRDLRLRNESTAALQRTDLESRLPANTTAGTNTTDGNTATNLLTEQVGDGDANCLEEAATGARPGRDNIVFLSDNRTAAEGNTNDAGHTLIEDRASGRVWDPRDGEPPQNPKAWTYRNVDDWNSRQGTTAGGSPAYSVDARVKAETVQSVLAAPAEQRAQLIADSGDAGLQKVADRMYADDTNTRTQVFLSDSAPAEERARFAQIDNWAKDQREYRPDDVIRVLNGESELGQLTDAERTRVMDYATDQWRGSSRSYDQPPTNHNAIQLMGMRANANPELASFVSKDFAARAVALTESAAGVTDDHPLVAQAASFATSSVAATRANPALRTELIESLGDKAPAFTQALQLHDMNLLDGGSAYYGGVPGGAQRAGAASMMLEAAGQNRPTPASTALVNSMFATTTNDTFAVNPELGRTMSRALANHAHPDDPAKRDAEARRFEGILSTEQGRDLLFGRDHSLASRAENVALMRAHPEWNADTMRQTDNGWDNPTIMKERAQPRARDYLELRGDQPVELRGTNLDNTVGFAMGFPVQGIPANETAAERDAREAAVARGEYSYYRGEPAQSATQPVIDQIRAVGGPNAQVTVLPIQYSSGETGPVDLALFRVQDQTTGQDRYVDNLGRRYDSFDDWKNNNQLPPGNMTYPTDGHLRADPAGGVQLSSGNTPKTIDTFGEHVTNILDKAALVGGIIAGGALLIGTGGVAAPIVAGAAGAWGAYRAGESLVDRGQHGQSLNPLTDAGARSDWLALGANVLGVAGAGATAAAARFARGGSALAPAAATAAGYLNVAAAGADGAAAADAGYTLATRWDQLSGGERAQLALSMGFFGVAATRGAAQSGGRVTDMFDPSAQRQRILEGDPMLAGTRDAPAQIARLGSADPNTVAQLRARQRTLPPEEQARFNAELERALIGAGPGRTNDVLRLYATVDPAQARATYERIQSLPIGVRANTWDSYRSSSEYIDRTITTDPALRTDLQNTIAQAAGNPRITGFDDWARFSTNQRTGVSPQDQARNLVDDVGELRVAQTLTSTLRPGETVRVGNDAHPYQRHNGEDLPSFDLRIEGPNGTRNVEVLSVGGRPTVGALGNGINHAAAKVVGPASNIPSQAVTQGRVEGAVRLDWPPSDSPRGGGLLVTAPNGDMTLRTANGLEVPQGNFFADYVNLLNNPQRAPRGVATVDQLTVYDRAGNELYRYSKDANGLWTGQAAQ